MVERLAESGREPDDPGQVFKQPALSYTEAMETFVEASQPLSGPRKGVASSDRGVHFTAQVFQQLAPEANFIHVVIARHRPQSNGIAERFVRTIKEWLADKTWASDQELFKWLHIFLPEYNDQPHQGLPLPGLSPNEFAKRLWLM